MLASVFYIVMCHTLPSINEAVLVLFNVGPCFHFLYILSVCLVSCCTVLYCIVSWRSRSGFLLVAFLLFVPLFCMSCTVLYRSVPYRIVTRPLWFFAYCCLSYSLLMLLGLFHLSGFVFSLSVEVLLLFIFWDFIRVVCLVCIVPYWLFCKLYELYIVGFR